MIEAKVFVFDATPAFPCILLQVTVLVGSYMIWAGVSEASITPEEPQDVLEHRISHGRLASDWACAMPPLKNGATSIGTPIFRSSTNDNAFSMSQRLARRFKKQIFLSLDVSLGNPANRSHVLQIEKNITSTLRSLETPAE